MPAGKVFRKRDAKVGWDARCRLCDWTYNSLWESAAFGQLEYHYRTVHYIRRIAPTGGRS